jgi:hypothetical protein
MNRSNSSTIAPHVIKVTVNPRLSSGSTKGWSHAGAPNPGSVNQVQESPDSPIAGEAWGRVRRFPRP